MLDPFRENFTKLSISNKSMIYLMWIYWAGSIISSMFINIYVFKFNNEIYQVAYYNIIFFTSTLIWFSFVWYIMSILKKDIKNMYYIWYIFFMCSFVILFILQNKLFGTYIFWVLYGLWNWSFRNAVHSQELINIQSDSRYFYSSCLSAWKNIISIVLPLSISVIFLVLA